MQDVFLFPADMGALTQLWAGTSPEAGKLNGEVRACCTLCAGERADRHLY